MATNSRSPEDNIDYLTVSDPVIHADGINKYTSYRVDCRPPNTYGIQDSNGNPTNTGGCPDLFLQNNQEYSSVLRRYSDFVWLYERLHKERAGSIVPHLPEKQAVGKFSPEFVEERRRGELNNVVGYCIHTACFLLLLLLSKSLGLQSPPGIICVGSTFEMVDGCSLSLFVYS
jgi:hypothetical protein